MGVFDADGTPVTDDSFFLLLNSHGEGVEVKLPATPGGGSWCWVINTENVDAPFADSSEPVDEKLIIGGRTFVMLRECKDVKPAS